MYRHCSVNCGKLILGDFNARMEHKGPDEDHILGDFTFGKVASHRVERPNRELLIEFCEGLGCAVA